MANHVHEALVALEHQMIEEQALVACLEAAGGDNAPEWVHLFGTVLRRLDGSVQALSDALRSAGQEGA